MNMIDVLTEEEKKLLNDLFKESKCNQATDKGSYNRSWEGSDWFYDYEESGRYSGMDRRRHEWKPVLLIYATVYNCKHCGTHKEKAKGDFCDEEINR